MTKIHPEAVALLKKHRGTTFRPGGEHYVENLTTAAAISQALFERDALRAQVAEMWEALKPFAEAAEGLKSSEDDDAIIAQDFIPGSDLVVCDVADLRKAHSILSKDNPND